jgi:hypothetical protein
MLNEKGFLKLILLSALGVIGLQAPEPLVQVKFAT